ncbi:MAG: rod shape-determining protein MreC [Oscillospiraceae bacterium]|jgi:rod shape-determining protein MreC|nr:rod shape-determining protein MreC [Oscillospiraceae bacterium]
MNKFLKQKGIRLALALTAVVAAITIASAIWGRSSPIGAVLKTITSPFERAVTALAGKVEDAYGLIFAYEHIKEENAELRLKISAMEAEIRDARDANAENIRLRALLDLIKVGQNYKVLAAAKLISRSSSGWSSTFTIGEGSITGIERGDCVITEHGYLVGLVTDVAPTTATMRSIIDVDSGIGAIIDRNGVTGIASGDFKLMRESKLSMKYLPDKADILNGDTVMTSGSGEVFPAGIVIGYVTAYTINDSGMEWVAEISPAADLDAITEVFVVRRAINNGEK